MTTSPPERPDHDDDRAVLEEAAQILEDALSPDEAAAVDLLDSRRRMVLVHAHPDDETTSTGITIARYAGEGAHVTLVTCTRGELGEIVAPGLAHLADPTGDPLGEHRASELMTAAEALGLTDVRFLGGPGRYRDSGMAGEPSNDDPRSFALADLDEAAGLLVEALREVRPQVLVTYDEKGGYGHPDHVMAHRVAMRAVELAADPTHGEGEPWEVAKVYWSAQPQSWLRDSLRRMKAAGVDLEGMDPDGDLAELATADELVTTAVAAPHLLDAKIAAWRAHDSQIAEDSFFLAMRGEDAQAAWGTEYFRLVRGTAVPDPTREDGRESDLFAGL